MIERKDLTRWNRASLTRFRYVDGKAGEYLDILREQLVDKFKDPKTKRVEWLNPAEKIPANEIEPENKTETLLQRQERLSRKQQRILESYHQDRRDWAWEISRTFARACHIISEHTNAYANEGYLGTATQWEHVRRLVEMLDYHPAPPASATTRLAFIAKENKIGTVAKGFQVKYSPPNGGAKVVFETLEDLLIDSSLNGLRPKGWDKSDASALSAESSGETDASSEADEFSRLANKPVIHIQGVGTVWAGILDKNGVPLIKDLLNLNPFAPEFSRIDERILRELKAKAAIVSNFELEAGWLGLSELLLPNIASASPSSLAESTGKSVESVEALQQRIELVGACLDHYVYKTAKLTDLVASLAAIERAVVTSWYEKSPPKVSPGQVAMVHHQSMDKAEAATVAVVDKASGQIKLLPSLEYTWGEWPKSEAILNVVPRWKRECWLNGYNAIRTEAPHGLSAESYVSWKIDSAYISWKVNNEWGEYELRLRKVDNLDDLVTTGSSLLIVALVDFPENPQLHFRIFDQNEIKADITESALLNGEAVTFLKQRLTSLPDGFTLSQEEQRLIFEIAMSCFQKWRYAKVIEADKRDLRLELSRPLPHEERDLYPQEGVDLYELRPIEGSVFPADYDAVVLLGEDDSPAPIKSIPPELPEPEDETLFCLRNVITGDMESPDGEGGGLLPPASLPEIGCFLFPSPMLPLDLVKAAVELMLSIGVMAIPSTGEIVIKGMPFGGLLEGAEDPADAASKLFDMLEALEGIVQEHNDNCEPLWEDGSTQGTTEPIDEVTGLERPPKTKGTNDLPAKLVVWRDELSPGVPDVGAIKESLTEMLKVPDGKEATILFQKLTEDIIERGPLLAIPKAPMVKAVVQASDPQYMFNGSTEIGTGDWVVGKFSDELKAAKVSTVNRFTDTDRTETFSLSFESLSGRPELQKVYADFRGEIIAKGSKVNNTSVDPDKLDLEDVPESLKVGQDVLLTAEGKDPVAAKIGSIDGNTLKTNPPATGFTKGELIILGNVVLAGHGEGKPAKILGSGDAAKSNQTFTLEVKELSFTPDATKSAGGAAAIEVEVAGRVWEQVSTLKDSAPGDFHYAIRMTEEAYVKIIFGDGEHGRRLPSGTNNIRVRFRVGSGLAGNVPARGLEKPVNPHPLVDAVRQPVQAAGGGDMENVASLRENAPPTLLALERAVSLSDFSHLAASQSSVWQAKAFSQILHGSRTESVRVVIVPAGGVKSPDINEAIRSFLQQHTLPGVLVTVDDCVKKRFSLSIIVRVKIDEFIAEEVEKAVASALIDHFALKNRKLGQHLYLSEVYKIVEAVLGVENSICVLKNATTQQLIRADNESTVVYLDTHDGSTLEVTHEVYRP
jgi:hypothetical protein